MQQYAEVVQNRNGDVLQGVRVTIKNLDGSTATVYSDNSGAASANPLTTDVNGGYSFFALEGPYLVSAPGAGSKRISVAKSTVLDYPPVDRLGVADSAAGFAAAASAFAGKQLPIPAGTYKIATNLSLSCDLVFERGAKLVVADGVTITISGQIIAPERSQIFDWVGTGAYSLTGVRRVNVRWFGANPSAGVDNQPPFQKSMDSLAIGHLFAPGGTYEFYDSVTSTRSRNGVIGESKGSTIFTKKGLASNLFKFISPNVASTQLTDVIVKDVTFQTVAGDVHTGGAFVWTEGCTRVDLKDILMVNPFYGIVTRSTTVVDQLNIDSSITGTASFVCQASFLYDEEVTAVKREPANVRVTNCEARAPVDGVYTKTNYGFLVRAADGIWFTSCYGGAQAIADLAMIPQNGDTNLTGVKVNGFWADPASTTGDGINISGSTTGTFGFIDILGSHVAGGLNGLSGIRVIPGTTLVGLKVDRNMVLNWKGNGIVIGGVGSIYSMSADGNTVMGCGVTAGNGISISVSKNFTANGNMCGYKTDGTTTALTAYGMSIALGCDNFVATGNMLHGNTTGGLNDASGAVTKTVANNQS